MKTDLIISDNDLILRPLARDDIEMLRSWRNQETIRNSFVFKDEITKEQQSKWYEKYSSDVTDCMFIALFENVPIGASALYCINDVECSAEFGRLMLGDVSRRGLGLGKRITRLTTRMGFEFLGLQRIYLEVFEENTHAFKIYEELGYRLIGHAVKNDKKVCIMEIHTYELNQ